MPPGSNSLMVCSSRCAHRLTSASLPPPATNLAGPLFLAATLGADAFLPVLRSAPPPSAAPTPKAAAGESSRVMIDCPLQGWDAVEMEGKRGTGGWELLAVCLKRKFTDTRAPLVAGQPEVRDYRCRFRDGDETQELYSDVVRVTTKP